MEQDGWSLLQRTIKIYLKVYLRVVVKLKTAACEGKGVGRRIRRAQKQTPAFLAAPSPQVSWQQMGCPTPPPHHRVGGHVADPNPDTGGKFRLPVVEELTFRTVIPINVIFFLKHSGRR